MPEMSGPQFRVEQQRDPRLAGIPTIVLTGAGLLYDASANELATEVLKKPIALDELLAAVRRHAGNAVESAGAHP
jgi:CheY-like chemotaxis protein